MTDSDVRRLEDKVDELGKAMARLEGSLKPTFDTLTARQDAAEIRGNDVETRLRSLERFRYAVPSAAVLSILVTVGTFVYYLTHG